MSGKNTLSTSGQSKVYFKNGDLSGKEAVRLTNTQNLI